MEAFNLLASLYLGTRVLASVNPSTIDRADLSLDSYSGLALTSQPVTSLQLGPTPTPKTTSTQSVKRPQVPQPAPADLENWFNLYATANNIEVDLLKRIAYCESHYHAGSISKNGTYAGMYQYSASTWASTRNAMGLDPNPDLRLNPEEAIKTSAWKIAHGGLGAWPHCGRQ